ncbi:LysR family transcriptional regulator [Paraburkholderia bannensis]|uniref:LysR family transcriptional regulator n=1 Tax=Paraburkholderia bannensis TaxID=765414 RepID=UPI002ABD6B04|nr:LysR substrate-binding domain-containing protein [Paraburkholderia bannensis]
MELRHLRYFVAVAEEGHFGRAAERLHIVPPALSVQIRALEEELGAVLFARTTRKVELTEAGRLLLVEARRMLDQADHARRVVRSAVSGETGIVRIGFVGNAVAAGRLPDDLLAFHAAWPGVTVELHEMAPALQQEAVLAGRLDIGYCPSLETPFGSGLSVRSVGNWSWKIIMSTGHRLAKRRALKAVEFTDEPFIIYGANGEDEGQLQLLLRLLGQPPKIAHKVSSTLSVLGLVAAGFGCALVPASLDKLAVPNVVSRKLVGCTLDSELFAISRATEEWGAVRRYLEMLEGATPT